MPARSGTRCGTPGSRSGQSVRTVKEALAVADDDLDALTALLDVRLVVGDVELATDLARRVRELAPRRRDRVIDALGVGRGARLDATGTRSPRCSSPT